jgi:FkbM family methyltransferase
MSLTEFPATHRSIFTTPNGHPVEMTWREGCADWNNMTSSLTEDEYRLRGLDLSGVALDIGAYIGGVTVGLLVDHPDLHVISVEPLPENLALLRENAQSDRLRIVEGAVGDSGTIRYDYAADNDPAGDFSPQHRYYGNSSGFELLCAGQPHKTVHTTTYTIADLVPEGDIALCKIDCEGGEWAFLDSPDVARIALIVGEWHPNGNGPLGGGSPDALAMRLGATHDLTVPPYPGIGPGNFWAVRR